MIVAEQKPLKEIRQMLEGRKKVLAVGCGTCVTVCLAGGRQETAALASSLRMATRIDGQPVEVDEAIVQRQCEWEYIDTLATATRGIRRRAVARLRRRRADPGRALSGQAHLSRP